MADAATQTAPTTDDGGKKKKKKDTHPRDPAREVVETIVFVVVLVLLLKLFVTEAFVIPTGSMAETLFGYQKIVKCPKCGHDFPVNSHDEVEPDKNGVLKDLVGYTCPNCRFHGRLARETSPQNRTGDRVLVLKPLYHLRKPERGDVVVFKFPEEPQERHIAQNYIKRAMGFGGETIAIWRGKLYVTLALEFPKEAGVDDYDLWKPQYMHANDPRAVELFEASRKAGFPNRPIGELPREQAEYFRPLIEAKTVKPTDTGFVIVRRPDDQILACMRNVWNNDQQPKELAGKVPNRWAVEDAGRWQTDDVNQPRVFNHAGDTLDWVRYRHLIWNWDPTADPADVKPRPIDNFLGYNAGEEVARGVVGFGGVRAGGTEHWVGDLIVECEADVRAAGAEVVLELSKGENRFRATFGGGKVVLTRTGPGGGEVGSAPCKVNGPGKYKLRFANVDNRLRVWVNDKAIKFGPEVDYTPAEASTLEGWTEENDVRAPASIGAKGAVAVREVRLYRDIYYTPGDGGRTIFHVQPGHYLCLGDNSAASKDSRSWGVVPERLMLGKAVFVFWPASIYAAFNRLGFIK